MSVPKYYQFFPYVLDCLADGEEHNLKEIAEYCADKFKLTDEDKRNAAERAADISKPRRLGKNLSEKSRIDRQGFKIGICDNGARERSS